MVEARFKGMVAGPCLAMSMTVLGAGVLWPGQVPSPPERYGALNAWVRGEIVEMQHSGGLLLVRAVPEPGSRRSEDYTSDPTYGALSGRPAKYTSLELRYAKGWVYLEDPDGGPQTRVSLKEGRAHFKVGQMIRIGRSTQFRGGFDRIAVRSETPLGLIDGTQMKFKDWILVRIDEFR